MEELDINNNTIKRKMFEKKFVFNDSKLSNSARNSKKKFLNNMVSNDSKSSNSARNGK